MNVVKGMRAFVEVAKQGSFAKASRSLDLSKSIVSRHVIDLESWLGVELLLRTTRTQSLTEQGRRYFERCQQILEDIDGLEAMAKEEGPAPRGTLRLTAPSFFAKECLHHLIPGYLETYPRVRVEVTAIDRFVDLVEEGFDLALRIGKLSDSSLVARKLLDIELVAVASPSYLARHAPPARPEDLEEHNCIVDGAAGFRNRWPMKSEGKPRKVAVEGSVAVNGGELARNLAVAGLGVALLPRFFVLEQLDRGELVTVLDGYVDFQAGLFAVYPQRRHPSAKVRGFIDYVVAHLDQLQAAYGP
ncbi:MAG: LysR family transcriptional regulator [Myxococcota bacterium]